MPRTPTTGKRPKTGGRQKGTPNKPTGLGKRPKTGGRQKGTPNKATAAIREAMLQVFADIQDRTGRENGHLFDWARGNATDFYKLAARLMPREVAGGDDGGPAITRVELVAVTPDYVERKRGQRACSRRAAGGDDWGNAAGNGQAGPAGPGPIPSELSAGDEGRARPTPAPADPALPPRAALGAGNHQAPSPARRRPHYPPGYGNEKGWMG